MRLLTGGTLAERLLERIDNNLPLPALGETAELLKGLASALDYAHSQGVIHRDMKPSNVMFDNHGQAHIVHFGIAKLMDTTSGLTGVGLSMGTPSYMPPEQWRADTLVPAPNQYPLRVLVYALVT